MFAETSLCLPDRLLLSQDKNRRRKVYAEPDHLMGTEAAKSSMDRQLLCPLVH